MEWLVPAGWLLSFGGYAWFFASRSHRAFAPVSAMGALSLAVYALGLCGWLRAGAYGLMALGLGLLALMLLRRDRSLLHWDVLAFALGCGLLFWRYQGSLLVAYDDFSHWGMLVRRMLLTDALPASSDRLIIFQSYPPGAACWLWYVCRFLGGRDGMMLSAQAWLVLAALWPLTALLGRRGRQTKSVGLAVLALITLSLFQGTASLMVDNLLSALAIGAVALCAWSIKEKQPVKTPLALLLALLCLVKDSGLFLAAVCVAAYGGLCTRSLSAGKRMGRLAIVALPAAVARLAWYVHIKLAFPAADTSRHALTLANLRLAGSDKSYEDMLSIAKSLAQEAFSLQNQAVHILLLMALLYALLRLSRAAGRRDLWVPIVSLLVYGGWLAGLLGMYIFSMPVEGALRLVAFERYNSTCALFLYGIAAVWLLYRLWDKALPGALLLVLPLLLGSWRAGLPRLVHDNYDVPMRRQIQALWEKRPLEAGESGCLLLSKDENAAFASYMGRYVFQDADLAASFRVPDGAEVVYALPGADTQTLSPGVILVEVDDL